MAQDSPATSTGAQRALAVLALALLCVTPREVAQAIPVNVPELCHADSAAVFLGFAIRETRSARVFTATAAQRFALLRLEAEIMDELHRAPLSQDDRRTIEDIYLRDAKAWEQGAREVAESSSARDSLLRGSYRIIAHAAAQELGVRCRGRLRWPALHAEADQAAELQ